MKVIAIADATDSRKPTMTLFEVAHLGGRRDWLAPAYPQQSEFRKPSAWLTRLPEEWVPVPKLPAIRLTAC